MENKENLVAENAAENTENTAEKTPKMFTEDEMNAKVDELLGKKIARREAKIRKEYDRKYGELEEVLKAGTGKQSVEELTGTFKNFYSSKGVKMPEKPTYSDNDIETLARADAEDIIRSGFDEVVEEADRLKEIGAQNMTAREKALFIKLTSHIQNTERHNALSQIGVTDDVYESKEFKDFAAKFNSNTPITDVYNIYKQTQPKTEHRTMGSMKTNAPEDNGVKDYYSHEEAMKFTKQDFDRNPELYRAVVKSMQKWK